MNDKNLTQASGDGSENYQAGLSITVNKTGLSIEDAKEVLLLLMEQNFIRFSEQALEVARKRVEEMTTDYLNGLAAKNPNLIENVQEPGVQMALVAAQKEYVKTGDKYLADLLTKMLIERTSQPPRTLLQISLDEGISAIGKLTNNQINIMLLNLIMSSIVKTGIKSLYNLKNYFDFYVKPVSDLIKIGGNDIPHIVSCGCAYITSVKTPYLDSWIDMYAGLLNKGFTSAEADNLLASYEHVFYLYPKLFMPCLHDKSKKQINAMNQKGLENILLEYEIDGELGQILMMMFINNIMSHEEITNYFSTFGDYMKKAAILWDRHLVSMFALSNIGRVVGIAAYNNLFNASLSYSAWIPD